MASREVSRYVHIARVWITVVLLVQCSVAAAQDQPVVRFGILSFRPVAVAQVQWEPLQHALEAALPGQRIEVIPMPFPKLDAAAKAGELEFILTNPGHFVLLRNRYGAAAIATMIPLHQGRPVADFGGVIFTRAERTDIASITDLAGKSVVAVAEESLGGYLMQRWEFEKQAVKNVRFQFTGMPQDRVVEAILAKQADAGCVRTGVLEAMADEGRIDLKAFKVLNVHPDDDLPFLHSTDHYPEWTAVASHHVKPETARAVAIALLSIKHTDAVAKSAQIAGFTTPADYTPVETLMLRLHVHPGELKHFDFSDVTSRYRVPIQIALATVLAMVVLGILLIRVNRRLAASSVENQRLLSELNVSEALYHGLFEHMSSGVLVCEALDNSSTFLIRDFNHAAELMENVNSEQVIGKSLVDVFPRMIACGLYDVLHRVSQTGQAEHFMSTFRNADGITLWRNSYVYRLLTGEVVVISDDVTPQKQAEMALRDSHDSLQLLLDSMAEGAYGLDNVGNCTFVNKSFLRLLGYRSADEVLGKNIHALIHYADANGSIYPASDCRLHNVFRNGESIDVTDEVFWRKDGVPIPIEYWAYPIVKDGAVIGSIATFIDITERKRAEDEIRALAFYDTLTKLPNRRMLNDRLRQVMAASKRHGWYGAVMFVDLDNFKPLNDLHGHDAGDLLLIEAAQRIAGCMRAVDTVARFGGDEFVVVISELGVDQEEAAAQANFVAEKIRTRLAEPYVLKLHQEGQAEQLIEHYCTSSIGVALILNHEMGLEEVLKMADLAMYQAKEGGRNVVKFYAG